MKKKKLKVRKDVNVNHFNFQILFKVLKTQYILTNCHFIQFLIYKYKWKPI